MNTTDPRVILLLQNLDLADRFQADEFLGLAYLKLAGGQKIDWDNPATRPPRTGRWRGCGWVVN
jgi:hypothetical protein